MYQSFHSYHLTRPYPYRWFSPIALVGGIIATVVFSLLNVASQGYTQYTQSTTNPNGTLAQRDWLTNWPSFLVGTQVTCESSLFALQSQVYTNKTALPFRVQRVWRIDRHGETTEMGMLEYFNQPLQQCNITRIYTDLDIRTTRSPGQISMMPAGGAVTGEASCYFETTQGRTYVDLLVIYDPVASSQNSMRYFVDSDQTHQANLYWANSMMRFYWADVMWKFAIANKKQDNRWFNGNVQFGRENPEPGRNTFSEAEIMDKDGDFFGITCFFNRNVDPDVISNFDFCQERNITDLESKSKGPLHMPDFWHSANTLSKSVYFAMLADLGQADQFMPNPFSQARLLEDFSRGLSETREKLFENKAFAWGINDAISYSSFKSSDFPDVNLNITPSVLSSSYLCKVRKLKSSLSLIISVLVADIVLLSSTWRAYVWAVDTFWVGKAATLPPCSCHSQTAGSTEVEAEEVVPLNATK